jgi:hypothetical protein
LTEQDGGIARLRGDSRLRCHSLKADDEEAQKAEAKKRWPG